MIDPATTRTVRVARLRRLEPRVNASASAPGPCPGPLAVVPMALWFGLVILIVREHRAIEAGERPEIRGEEEREPARH